MFTEIRVVGSVKNLTIYLKRVFLKRILHIIFACVIGMTRDSVNGSLQSRQIESQLIASHIWLTD